nr:immunoglobulin heavy chain junction region [Macaca mulatta]MOW99407.1 immunoglobulin heavy chain junction region [Macaca mulatta]MOX00806.1 immunoglobulin heavy chain junction region [Macaca mulatta]MOX02433.1 immunoglobulin heavy chain junction region [Macaca mulatta]MOX06100.1 immunoglobulin heavy chain junction region [Macaca mulatta]
CARAPSYEEHHGYYYTSPFDSW